MVSSILNTCCKCNHFRVSSLVMSLNFPCLLSALFSSDLHRRGIIKWGAVSVCRVPRSNSRMERPRKPKIGRMEAYSTSNPWTCLEVKRSRLPGRLMLSPNPKVHHIFRTGRPTKFKLSGRPTYAHRWSMKTHITDKRHDLQGQRSRSRCHVVRLTGVGPISRERKVLEIPKLVANPTIMRNVDNVKPFNRYHRGRWNTVSTTQLIYFALD